MVDAHECTHGSYYSDSDDICTCTCLVCGFEWYLFADLLEDERW